MSTSTKSSAAKSTGAKSSKSTGRKTGAKSGAKTGAKSTGRKSVKSAAPVKSSAPAIDQVGSARRNMVLPEGVKSPVKSAAGLIVRRFPEHSEAAQLATKRFQSTASRPGADPTKQSGVTTANIADVVAELKRRKLSADELIGVPTADVIRYAEKGELSKRAESGELVRKLRDFTNATFGQSNSTNKLRGKRIAALFSVLMSGGMKGAAPTAAAKSSAKRSAVKTTSTKSSTGRKSGRKGGRS